MTLFKHSVNIYLKYCSGCNRMHQKMKCANVHSVKCMKPCRVQGFKSRRNVCYYRCAGVYEGGGGPGAERKRLFRQRRNICIHGGVDQP